MKITKKLFVAIMTMALLVITFGTTTFAWFTLGTETKVNDFQVNVTAGKGMELSEDGSKWKNSLAVASDGVVFADLHSANGVNVFKMDGQGAVAGTDYFEKVIYVRITKTKSTTGTGFTKDFDNVQLLSVSGKDKEFTGNNGDTTAAAGSNLWLSDATVAGLLEENKYYKFDPLNAVEISFTPNGDTTAKAVYGYENSESWGGHALNGLAKLYADAKEYDVPDSAAFFSPITTYTTTTPADPDGFVKYDGGTKANVLAAADFDDFASLGLTGITGDDDHYVYAKLTIRVWLEGWDADCINAILGTDTVFNLEFKAVKND